MEVPENIRNIKFRAAFLLRRMMARNENNISSRQQNAAFASSNYCFGDVKLSL